MDKKIICITGASKGIGAQIAEIFAEHNYDIILHYNSSASLAETLKKKLEEKYLIKVYLLQADLSKEEDIVNLINYIKGITNNLDILINNASLSLDNDMLLKTKEEFMNVLEVNLVAPFLLIKGLLDVLQNGVVINISSTDGINTGSIYNLDYSASKSGLNVMTSILGKSLENIRIYGIAPNWVKTESVMEMDPTFLKSELIRVGQKNLLLPEEVATKIFSIVSDSSIPSGSIIRMDDKNE